MIALRRNTLAALICIALGASFDTGHAADAASPCSDGGASCRNHVRGRIVDDSGSFAAPMPPSSEAEHATLAASGLAPSELRRMRKDGGRPQPTAPAELSAQIADDAHANFFSGSAELTLEAKAKLDAVVARLRDVEVEHIRIVGHTDDQRISARLRPTYADNQQLSEARAASVAGYLKRKLGLDADRFAVAGRGAREPVADNATSEGMARNRRVGIQVWGRRRVAAVPAIALDRDLCVGTGNGAAPAAQPFRISVDGVPQDGGAIAEADRQRCVDVALAGDRVQVRYDPLEITPALNAWAVPNGAPRDRAVTFRAWSNYAAWIEQAEIRIFPKGASSAETPLAVLPMRLDAAAAWQPPVDTPNQLFYVLRVRDAKGRFDETAPQPLTLVERPTPHADADTPGREALIGYGKDRRAVANIPVHGGTVTVNGHVADAASGVEALGATVPVGRDGRFAAQQILPSGSHAVLVKVAEADGRSTTYRRNVVIPNRDWFYVAQADVTAGHGSASANATLVDPSLADEVKHSFVDGRLAFYAKGAFGDGYRLTASADTREQPLSDLFSNFASKDPRYLLYRLDPDQYYPVYGDDSTAVDDAPTQGKFFVRLQKNDSEVMWGNFLTAWTGTELTQYSRGLYGANALWKSSATTGEGERTTTLNAFAADPGTVASREEFRGTGGSLYYLHRQDVTVGSERVWVEIRDRDSGLVLQRTLLVPGSDYDVNYLQGRILLREPLSSEAGGSGLVRTGSLSGNPAYLVATYEFVPGVTAIDQLATGLRGEHWFGDHFRLGLTGYHQAGDGTDQTLGGLDATLRYKPGTYVRVEGARSKGDGSGTLSSTDGGFGFADQRAGAGDGHADARRVEAALALSDFDEDLKGNLSAYWQDRGAGFSAPGQITLGGESVVQRGARADVPLGARTRVTLKADQRDTLAQDVKSGEATLRRQLDANWTASLGMRAEDRGVADTTLIQSPILAEHGERTDAIVKLDYQPDSENAQAKPDASTAPWNAYGFVQQTLARSGTRSDNDRVGLGGGWQVSDRVRLDAEASDGDGGVGGKLGSEYRIDDRSSLYMQYRMETERPDLAYSGRFGSMVVGARSKLDDRVSVYEESRRTTGSGQDGLTHAFGIDLAPSDRWSTGFKFETGTVSDPYSGDTRRRAAGVSVGYKDLDTSYASSLEYRREQNDLSGRRTSWLTRNSVGRQLTPAWRLLGKLDLARSQSSQGVFFDGDYTEGVLGAAYRPVDNDRWNTLIKYTYLYDLPSPGQTTPGSAGYGGSRYAGTVADYSQKSQVFAIDTIWDVTPWLSLGAKYGYRWGSLKPTRTAGDWFDSTATLMVLRGEWHFVRNWSGLLELRRLHAREADDTRSGALVAVYRRVTRHVKIGVGYNFTDFSDKLTDLSYDHRGVFLNVLSTF